MGALEIYLKIFMQKLWNILWPLFENKKMSKKIVIDQRGDEIEKLLSPQGNLLAADQKEETHGITKVPDGYSLKYQGINMCDGQPMESGGPYSVLDEFDDKKPVTYIGDDPFLLMIDRAKRKCDATEDCKFISFWMDGSYSMYNSQNCANSKEGLNTSVTLENLHQFSGRRAVVNEDTGHVELGEAAPEPEPEPKPQALPIIDSREKCDNYINNTLKPYDSSQTYPGLTLSNKNNYCTSMVVRPGIARACQERACRFTSGTKKGGIKEGLPPGWQEVKSGMQYDANYGIHEDVYYWNTNTNETTWQKPRNISDGKDFFEMKEFCPGPCLTLIGNELPKSQSRSGHMDDAIGEILQIPDHTSGNPWMPENNIFNQLPDITIDDCLAMNEVKAGRQYVRKELDNRQVWEDIPAWKPTKSQMFDMNDERFKTVPGFLNPNSAPEEHCAENPAVPGYGLIRTKAILGVTDNKKACRVQFDTTSNSCNRNCRMRFLKTEAREAGYENKYKTRITSREELFKKSGGNLNDPEMQRAHADLMITDLRSTWEIGRKVGVRWGIDERPGTGVVNADASGLGVGVVWGEDAPYGYKIWAEFAVVSAPKLGFGKCPIHHTGWYRTAKVPITPDEIGFSGDYSNLKANYNYGSKVNVSLVNENAPDQVLIVSSPESGYITEVYSKTNTDGWGRPPGGKRNWNYNGPITLDTPAAEVDYSLDEAGRI